MSLNDEYDLWSNVYHLTPKSIYSYIDDLVIANCLIDDRIGCACFATYFICHLIVWACWCIFYSFEDIHLLFWLFGFFSFSQLDGQECLRTFFSYLCFSHLKLYSCYITKFDQVRFEPLCVRNTRSPRFVIDLNFLNLSVHFGMTGPSSSVTQSSLSWSRFQSWCNRFELFGHTELFHSVTPTGSGYI